MTKSVDEKLEDISFPTKIHKFHVTMDNFIFDTVDYEIRKKVAVGVLGKVKTL